MTDMLVKLYALPPLSPALAALRQQNIEIRRPIPAEKHTLAAWVRQYFPESWGVGCEAALENRPATCYIAVLKTPITKTSDEPYNLPDEILLGFACYDIASKGMFGAMGVHEDYRQQGIGRALLLASLYAMKDEGYAYAVIGWVASIDYYARAVGAIVIPDSEPGIFRGQLIGYSPQG